MAPTLIQARAHIRRPHAIQAEIMDCTKKRIIIRGGRRGGKTETAIARAVMRFLAGRRQLYATPTSEQLNAFWKGVKRALQEPIERGVYYKNETEHIVERVGTEQRIRAKTAWNADMLRGDYTDDLYLDEWQLMDEATWDEVGQPMLLDNDGDALFIYTPPSLASRSMSKAKDPRHASKLFKHALEDPEWATFHFTSHDNPYISETALQRISGQMSRLAYRQEILAEDIDEVAGAIWRRQDIDENRVATEPELVRIIVGVDPPGGATECGIVVGGIDSRGHGYVLEDASVQASPAAWGSRVVDVYQQWQADRVAGEKNYGGDMVENTIRTCAQEAGVIVSYKDVHASRGKAIRAEPIAALYEQGRIHHVGELAALEEEMCTWLPNRPGRSPNRMDALVWVFTELITRRGRSGGPGIR